MLSTNVSVPFTGGAAESAIFAVTAIDPGARLRTSGRYCAGTEKLA